MMNVQRIGIVAGGLAVGLWLFVAVAVVSTPASEGVNFAPVTIGLPATAVGIVAAVLLIISGPGGVVRGAAAISLVNWIALLYKFFFLSLDTPAGWVDLGLLIAAVFALGVSAGRAMKMSRRAGLR